MNILKIVMRGNAIKKLWTNPYDMPVFHQPVRIEQQLFSIAQLGGTKIPHEFKKPAMLR